MQLWEYEAVTEADPDDLIIISRDGVQYYSVSVENSQLKSGLKYWTETETEIYNEVHGVLGSETLAGNAWISGATMPRHLGMKWHNRYYETEELFTYGAISALSSSGAQPENATSEKIFNYVENPNDMTTPRLSPVHAIHITYGEDNREHPMGFSINLAKASPYFYICKGILPGYGLPRSNDIRGGSYPGYSNSTLWYGAHTGWSDVENYDQENKINYRNWKQLLNSTRLDTVTNEEAENHEWSYLFLISCLGSTPCKGRYYSWERDYISLDGEDVIDSYSIFGRAAHHSPPLPKGTYESEGVRTPSVGDSYYEFYTYNVIDDTHVYNDIPGTMGVTFNYMGATWLGIMIESVSEEIDAWYHLRYTGYDIDGNTVIEGNINPTLYTNFGILTDRNGNTLKHPALREEGYLSEYFTNNKITSTRDMYGLARDEHGTLIQPPRPDMNNFLGREITDYECHGIAEKDLKTVKDIYARNAAEIFKALISNYLKLNVYFPQKAGGSGGGGAGIHTEISVNQNEAFTAGILDESGDISEFISQVNIDPLTGRSKFRSLFEKHGNAKTPISDIFQVKLKPTDGIHISNNNVISATFNEDIGEILQEKILPGDGVGTTYDDANDVFIFSKNHTLTGYVSALSSRVPVYSIRSTDQQTGKITDELYFNIADLKDKVELPAISEGAGIDISVSGNNNTISSYGITKVSVNGAVQVKTTESGQTYIDIDSSAFNPNRTRSRSANSTKYISGYPVEYIKKENGYFSKDVDLSDLYNRVAALEQAVINQGGE